MNDNERYQQTYRVDSARLTGYDYGANGIYFVTICTRNREALFGEISTDSPDTACLKPTVIGQVVIDCWLAIPQYFPFIELDAFVLMPNHLHGIVWIIKPQYDGWQPNRFGPQSGNLAAVIQGFKAGVTKRAMQQQIDFGWQARYYDRIVRDENELKRIRAYIDNNPAQWQQDQNNLENLYM